MSNIYALIMAGGRGERFWPYSRKSRPKQLLALAGEATLIEQTIERISPLVPAENIIIITNQDYVAQMRGLLPDLPPENIVGEPCARDTAACIAASAGIIKQKSGNDMNSVIVTMPADHVIKNADALCRNLEDAISVARSGKIVTIGIKPSYPASCYGYIQCGKKIDNGLSTVFFEGAGFREKPDVETAKSFLEQGNFKWNGGMFIWTLNCIEKSFAAHCPELYPLIDAMAAAAADQKSFEKTFAALYEPLKKISIDYAVMEKSDAIVVADASFDWDDIGGWLALRNHVKPDESGNTVKGLFRGINSSNCIVQTQSGTLVAAIDLHDMIIVNTGDVTLICPASSADKIKNMVKNLSESENTLNYV